MSGSYWHSPTGKHVLTLEQRLLAEHIRRFHGDTVVWAGTHRESAASLQRCMVRNPLFMALDDSSPDNTTPALGEAALSLPPAASPPSLNMCVGELHNLPFKSGSVDGLLVHHGLEFAKDPRTALREITRVLAPGGRLILVGFNPLSLFGVRSLYSKVASDGLSGHHLINPLRLFDWLALLGFELQGRPLYAGHGLPFVGLSEKIDLQHNARVEDKPAWARPWAWMQSNLLPPRGPFGGLLIVNAIKQQAVGNVRWRTPARGRRLAPVTYPRVAAWHETLQTDVDINLRDRQ